MSKEPPELLDSFLEFQNAISIVLIHGWRNPDLM